MSFPVHILQCSPYGGIGLRAQSISKAWTRIANFLEKCATDVIPTGAELEVREPCEEALAKQIHEEILDEPTSFVGGIHLLADLAGRLADFGHVHAAIGAAAWRNFGVPTNVSLHSLESGLLVGWVWKASTSDEDPPERIDSCRTAWVAFAKQHEAIGYDEYTWATELRTQWTCRLRETVTGKAAPAELPLSEILATFAHRHSSAFLDLRFPYESADAAFVRAWRDACKALGFKLPAKQLRLVSPTRKGEEKLNRLHDFKG